MGVCPQRRIAQTFFTSFLLGRPYDQQRFSLRLVFEAGASLIDRCGNAGEYNMKKYIAVLVVLLAGQSLASDAAAGLGQAKAAYEISSQQKSDLRRALRANPNDPQLQAAYSQVTTAVEVHKVNMQAWRDVLNEEQRAKREALRNQRNRVGPAWLGGWGIR